MPTPTIAPVSGLPRGIAWNRCPIILRGPRGELTFADSVRCWFDPADLRCRGFRVDPCPDVDLDGRHGAFGWYDSDGGAPTMPLSVVRGSGATLQEKGID